MFVQYFFDNSTNDIAYKTVGSRNIPYHKSDVINIIKNAFENDELHKGIIIDNKENIVVRFRCKKADKILKIFFPKTNGILINNRDYLNTLKKYVVSNNKINFINVSKLKKLVSDNRKLILKKVIATLAISMGVIAVGIPVGLLLTDIDNKRFEAEFESYRYDEHFIKDMQHRRNILEKNEIIITEEELKYYKSIFADDEQNEPTYEEDLEVSEDFNNYKVR